MLRVQQTSRGGWHEIRLGGVAAIALLATIGSASAAPIITPSTSPLCNLGTNATSNTFVTNSLPSNPCGSSQPEISSITFAGGSSTGTPPLGDPGHPSGVYAGSRVGSYTTPFGPDGTFPTENYLAAQPGGSVTVNYSTPQNSIEILWGTIDNSDNMNLVTDNDTGLPLLMITGAMVCSALNSQGIPCNATTLDGRVNQEVDITNITPFTSFTASDAAGQLSAFEFVPGTQPTAMPEPASLAILGAALAGFGILRRRRTA
jgi:hypothetical protein